VSTCTKWVTEVVITCKNWASKVEQTCSQWADEGSYQCSQWADEGSYQCSQWADQGSSQCCDWWPCSWGCQAFYWVANWVCQAWYWVANLVCQAWYWVANVVCIVFSWIVVAVCVIFSWVFSLVCVAWDTARCMLVSLARLIGRLFGDREPSLRIDHVFVLMLENRAFDHMFGFSRLKGVDPDGNPTTIIAADPSQNTNMDSSTHAAVPVTINPPADFALKGLDQDPGHEFEDTLMALCAQFDEAGNLVLPPPQYQPVPGGYPPITNGGFVENYMHPSNGQRAGNPARIVDNQQAVNDRSAVTAPTPNYGVAMLPAVMTRLGCRTGGRLHSRRRGLRAARGQAEQRGGGGDDRPVAHRPGFPISLPASPSRFRPACNSGRS
jgi:phospholipase C